MIKSSTGIINKAMSIFNFSTKTFGLKRSIKGNFPSIKRCLPQNGKNEYIFEHYNFYCIFITLKFNKTIK